MPISLTGKYGTCVISVHDNLIGNQIRCKQETEMIEVLTTDAWKLETKEKLLIVLNTKF